MGEGGRGFWVLGAGGRPPHPPLLRHDFGRRRRWFSPPVERDEHAPASADRQSASDEAKRRRHLHVKDVRPKTSSPAACQHWLITSTLLASEWTLNVAHLHSL